MKRNNLYQVGGLFSILMALGLVFVGIAFFLLPEPQQPGGAESFEEYMLSVAENSDVLRLSTWAWVVVALAGLGAIPAIIRLVQKQGEGWAIWARNLAYLALMVMAVENFRLNFYLPAESQAYAGADRATRQMISADNFHLNLDPNGWIQFGLLGLSILIISLLALRIEKLPRAWAIVGIVVALLFWLVVAGNQLDIPILFGIAAILGGIILGPVWFIWIGVLMRRLGPLRIN